MIPAASRQSLSRVNESEALAFLAAPVLLVDADGQVVSANAQACEMLGCSPEPTTSLPQLLTVSGVAQHIELPKSQASVGRSMLRLSDGRSVAAMVRALPSGGWVVALYDLGAIMSEDDRQSSDPVTSLLNREAFKRELARALTAKQSFVLFAIGLERFRQINDALGAGVGDALLRKVGDRLHSLVSTEDVIGRLGYDEFGLIRRGIASNDDIEIEGKRIVELIARAYAVEGHILNISASVGIARPAGQPGEDGLMGHANLALIEARAEGIGTCRLFVAAMADRLQERRRIELGLRRAMALKQLELHYQPQIHLRSGEVVSFEALLRWRREDGSFISPADFVPIAEETGLIVPIGDWVIRTACYAAARWPLPAIVAVNLSAQQFRGEGLVNTVVSALANSGLDPARLELEITESALLDDTAAVVGTLQSLRALGVGIAMDDFGTGYSSLSYLQKFPFDKIKIDQSFVRQMNGNAEAKAIVSTIASLGATLGMKITAEGVETQDQLAEIRERGCDYVQGFLTGRPMTAEAACKLLVDATLEDMRINRGT
ncbi:EAL domain-containing protein [Novosphingobium sp. JCM 18896]|uniref:EAL domain-containing protein n=1 Tax=Novosphingobium sp. JCM 18896 TaxID=2989731 RepID=UPI0022213048|nr:EAL domain-containing protein [Novosphingobium sp. JCM 18896]MCW1430290.1 EAL domain-containing protein [Novosphingobium sp. JCM 18896]